MKKALSFEGANGQYHCPWRLVGSLIYVEGDRRGDISWRATGVFCSVTAHLIHCGRPTHGSAPSSWYRRFVVDRKWKNVTDTGLMAFSVLIRLV